MKKTIKISQKFRKRITLFILLNFVSYTFLLAFPQKECDGVCKVEKAEKCQCSMEGEASCCDMMERNSQNDSFSSQSKISHSSCGYEYLVHEHNDFVIPKTIDSKVDFYSIIEINLIPEVSSVHKFFISHNSVSDVSPPIYLTVSSFLI